MLTNRNSEQEEAFAVAISAPLYSLPYLTKVLPAT
jgi:hypothetical protein